MKSLNPPVAGCTACRHVYSKGGHIQCAKDPHQHRTPEQRAIVSWLMRTDHPHIEEGCPSFQRFGLPTP